VTEILRAGLLRSITARNDPYFLCWLKQVGNTKKNWTWLSLASFVLPFLGILGGIWLLVDPDPDYDKLAALMLCSGVVGFAMWFLAL